MWLNDECLMFLLVIIVSEVSLCYLSIVYNYVVLNDEFHKGFEENVLCWSQDAFQIIF